jgi:hypothetical protein
MGARGKHGVSMEGQSWKDVAAYYLDLCAETFPELTVKQDD